VIREWWIEKYLEGRGRDLILRYCPGFPWRDCVKPRKTQNTRSPDKDLNPGRPEYEAGVNDATMTFDVMWSFHRREDDMSDRHKNVLGSIFAPLYVIAAWSLVTEINLAFRFALSVRQVHTWLLRDAPCCDLYRKYKSDETGSLFLRRK